MSAYLSLLARARELPNKVLRDPASMDLVLEMLGAVLSLEGPPPFPLEGEFKWEVVRTYPRSGRVGSPRFAAATWTTGTWTCLLMVQRSVPMGRGTNITLPDGSTRTTPHDSASGVAMDYIGYAIRHFDLKSSGPAVLMTNAGRFRTFIAWRPLQSWEPADDQVKGDVDNYLKTVADALSLGTYRVFRNDRDVARMIGTKLLYEGWDRPMDELLPALLETEVSSLLRQELDIKEIHARTGLTYKALAQYIPEAVGRIRKSGKKQKRAVTQSEADAIERGVQMLLEDSDLRVPALAIRLGVGSRALREAASKRLLGVAREALVNGKATLKEAAGIARMSSPGLKYRFKDDPEALDAIARRRTEHRQALAGMGVAARSRNRRDSAVTKGSGASADPKKGSARKPVRRLRRKKLQ